ncbi:Related to Dihydropteroate synthase [hydrothermal vent metagenome]|uniref:Related to Dihydropteroate synthase n=1 Tax=hydrothermal vent metagenome TaxID=652676 RepID=A0A3B1BWL8_9ZZZZ
MSDKHIHFITGRLASPALVKLLSGLSPGFSYDVITLPAQVAALMTTRSIARRIPANLTGAMLIPGGCKGDMQEIRKIVSGPVSRGPVDLNDLPRHFGIKRGKIKYAKPHLQIIAEIVDAPTMSIPQIVKRAKRYRKDGADWIDLGCMNDTPFRHLKETVQELRRLKFNVSVDSFNPEELIAASRGGARLFLSIYSGNISAATKLKGKVVVIPDPGKGARSLYKNVRRLEKTRVPFIMDPILDPLTLGAARSFARYALLRRKFPKAEIMMGVGNLLELTAVDNIGMSALLMGICAELKIDYALTTEVAGWNRDSVRQLSIARQIMEHAVSNGVLPKGFDDRLLVACEAGRPQFTARQLMAMSKKVRDKNFRIFVAEGFIHIFNKEIYIKTKSAQDIFDRLKVDDPSHAFYLGKELSKAETALDLGKTYRQEGAFNWGYLTKRTKKTR